ncbi:phospholipase D family protein [Pseudooceanicola nanhaiensis]|uniref:phospholipase D family protein n=1 Tax=Pseudooceanicola nanhaiensis TaxID=375761 RepID=UPI001CD331D3|nr:phospholipase D family protein [Pseudooceanicola nanhaiensis]MCA0919424.1 phospholipase D-like domain-containing protein [Pseudooceanicola nanhaiensis]
MTRRQLPLPSSLAHRLARVFRQETESATATAVPAPEVPLLAPLITASEMFPELERLALSAERELLLSFRIFDARTALRSAEALALDLVTWADLLDHVARKGVKIRLLLADFDPVFTADLHRGTWASARIFAARLPPEAEIIAAIHECRPAPLYEWIFLPKVKSNLRSLKRAPGHALTPLQHRALGGDWFIAPVTLHQKFAVADGARAIIGGIDVDERRWDGPDHDQRPRDTWHDVSMQVTGEIVPQIRSHFATCWERARHNGGTVFSAEAGSMEEDALDIIPDPWIERRIDEAAAGKPHAPSLLRTLSVGCPGPFRFSPETAVSEHVTAHLAAFERAERYIYVETQFFRHEPLARALAGAAARSPELELVLVLPTEPERVIFEGHYSVDARHGQALQLRCLRILRKAFGRRMTVVSPVQPRRAPEGEHLPVEGAGIVYVHSKVTLVDDHTGIVGSANLNGRSMLWDSEASVMFHDAEAIRTLRERLASNWLGAHGEGKPVDRVTTWREAALANAARQPDDRDGFAMPFPETRNRHFARYVPIVPAAMF